MPTSKSARFGPFPGRALLVIAALASPMGCERPVDPAGGGGDPVADADAQSPGGAGAAEASPAAAPAPGGAVERTAEELAREREELDRTLWRNEVAAQEHERTFIGMWDRLREADDPFSVLADVPLGTISIATPGPRREIGDGIGIAVAGAPFTAHDPGGWRALLERFREEGYRIEQTEWHHAEFTPADEEATGGGDGGAGSGARSKVTFKVHAAREAPPHRVAIDGALEVVWDRGDPPAAVSVSVHDFRITDRAAPAAFVEVLRAETGAGHARLLPLIVRDLDGDGIPEIVSGGLNRVWRHGSDGRFEEEPLVPGGLDIFDAGIIADFTGDGRGDLVAVSRDRRPRIWPADADGRFTLPSRVCCDVVLEFPKAFTAGDIDGDGDLDLFIGQYKFPYVQGAMPTPFYDANDGHPAILLRNDGDAGFVDVTEAAGLGPRRHRRTYSASFFDRDGDGDLDLITVNDFAGIDLHDNTGAGRFVEVTDTAVDERHLFGMAHAFGDFDLDGRVDLYAIGMSSTTVGRLDALGLARDDRPDITAMRLEMTFGNRLFRGTESGFVHAPAAAEVARTGWAWGTSAADFNLDGSPDLYVANGHQSGRSAADYCTRYWCHDVYTGSSRPDPEIGKLLSGSLRTLNEGRMSWNGFEKNVLWRNAGAASGFADVAYPLGVAFEDDSRGVVATDLDGDGRPDLLVVTVRIEGRGANHYTLRVLRNTLDVAGRRWIGVRLGPSAEGRSPLGATVVVRSGGSVQARPVVTGDSFSSQHPMVAHFGLGEGATRADVEIHWPGGERTVLAGLEVDRYHDVIR